MNNLYNTPLKIFKWNDDEDNTKKKKKRQKIFKVEGIDS